MPGEDKFNLLVNPDIVNDHMLRKNCGFIRRTGPITAHRHIANEKLGQIERKFADGIPCKLKVLLVVNQPFETILGPD